MDTDLLQQPFLRKLNAKPRTPIFSVIPIELDEARSKRTEESVKARKAHTFDGYANLAGRCAPLNVLFISNCRFHSFSLFSMSIR